MTELAAKGEGTYVLYDYFLSGGQTVSYSDDREGAPNKTKVHKLVENYKKYRNYYAQNIVFSATLENLSKAHNLRALGCSC